MGGASMWQVMIYKNGEQAGDIGVIPARDIRQLVKKMEKIIGQSNLKYKRWTDMRAPVYNIFVNENDESWYVASKFN